MDEPYKRDLRIDALVALFLMAFLAASALFGMIVPLVVSVGWLLVVLVLRYTRIGDPR